MSELEGFYGKGELDLICAGLRTRILDNAAKLRELADQSDKGDSIGEEAPIAAADFSVLERFRDKAVWLSYTPEERDTLLGDKVSNDEASERTSPRSPRSLPR